MVVELRFEFSTSIQLPFLSSPAMPLGPYSLHVVTCVSCNLLPCTHPGTSAPSPPASTLSFLAIHTSWSRSPVCSERPSSAGTSSGGRGGPSVTFSFTSTATAQWLALVSLHLALWAFSVHHLTSTLTPLKILPWFCRQSLQGSHREDVNMPTPGSQGAADQRTCSGNLPGPSAG